MSPVAALGKAGKAKPSGDPASCKDANRLSKGQASGNAEGNRFERARRQEVRQRQSCICERKERKDHELHMRLQRTFSAVEKRRPVPAGQRNRQSDYDARKRGVHTRFEHAQPLNGTHDHVETRAAVSDAVQDHEDHHRDRSKRECACRDLGGVERSDDDDRAQIVERRQRQQKHFQAHWNRTPCQREGLGPERANEMVRLGDLSRAGISWSLHSDMPMAPADPLFLMWCAVNRLTTSGRVAGPEQRVSAEQALRGVTIEAAYSLKLEDEVGSLTPGKLGNLTILSDNPLTVDPLKIKDITVWGTVMEGRVLPVPAAQKKADLQERRRIGDEPRGFAQAAVSHALLVSHSHH
jgi:hypothetical protein